LVASDTTDINGMYEFPEIVPGVDYAVCEKLELGWFQSYPTGSSPLPAGLFDCSQFVGDYGPVGYAINLDSQERDVDNNFGNWVEEGCTYTQGYWKTHSEFGPAGPEDDTWDEIGDWDGDGVEEGAEELFFLSGQTWIDVMWTAPKGGNAYYILAHQWIAAYLNSIKDEDPAFLTGEIEAAFMDAQFFFENTTPEEALLLSPEDREEVIGWADTLADFNEGITGPGHCE
jgi:hypothetical protein